MDGSSIRTRHEIPFSSRFVHHDLGIVQGDPSACGLGYVDISPVSVQPQYETELMPT